jgi:hypothetical protein
VAPDSTAPFTSFELLVDFQLAARQPALNGRATGAGAIFTSPILYHRRPAQIACSWAVERMKLRTRMLQSVT